LVKVSVALATYNGERFLPEQLRSLREQAMLPSELVISDDGSTDNTISIVESFREVAPFSVTILQGDHRGYVGNFFRAVQQCQGDLVALCDQDDVWMPTKLSQCVPLFQNPEVALVMHAADSVDDQAMSLHKHFPNITHAASVARGIFGDGPLKSFPLGFSLLFRQDVAKAVLDTLADYPDPYRFYFGHEMPFYWMAKAMGTAIYLPEELVQYRRHEGNVTSGNALRKTGLAQGLGNGAGEYEEFGQHAQYQAEFLQWLKGPDHVTQTFLDQWIRQRAALSKNFYARANLYRETRRRDKFKKFSRMTSQQSYKRRVDGGLGIKSLIKDWVFVWR
jgi:glycosyltransferase involved in cell wall biosynthesis